MKIAGYTKGELNTLLAPLWGDRKNFFVLFVRGVYFGTTGSIYAVSMKFILNALQSHNMSVFLMWIAVIACMMFFNLAFGYSMRNAKNRLSVHMRIALYTKYLQEYLTMDNNKVEQLGTGKVNNIIQKGIDNWISLIAMIPQEMTNVILRIVVAMYFIAFYLGWIGFVVVTCLFVVSFILSQYANKRMAANRREMRENYTYLDKDIVRLIMSKTEVIQNHKWFYEAKKITTKCMHILSLWIQESRMRFWGLDMQRAAVNVIQVFLLIYVGVSVLHGYYDLGLVAMFWMLSNQINGSISDLNDFITNFYQQRIYIDKLWETFDSVEQLKGYDTGNEFAYADGNMVLNHITYNYGKGDVLNDFSLTIEGCQKTAFVGISGSGKSTLIKLIAGYIHPQQGEIIVDGQALPNETNADYVSLKSYYKHIGYLTQEPNVFDGTIYENLTYALDHEPTKEELDVAINGAQCQFIYEFPEGVQTEIGEKGIKLSGGQRQRLAIAKVMLKNPQIILLDEPTSALDSFSEEEVTKAFNNLFHGRTVIVIAHRLQTVKKADRIIVLDHGKVVEEGNHDSLVKSGGVYAKMLELQSGF